MFYCLLLLQNNLHVHLKYLDLDEIKKRVNSGEDIIGRAETYKKIEIDNSFPKYILNNLENYKNWIIK